MKKHVEEEEFACHFDIFCIFRIKIVQKKKRQFKDVWK